MAAASVSVSAKPALDDLAKQHNLTPREVTQIGVSAINRSSTTVRANLTRRLTAEINLRAGDIRPLLSISNATESKLEGSVTVNRKPVPLIKFIGARQVKGKPTGVKTPIQIRPGVWRMIELTEGGGVSVKVFKNEPRELLGGAFIATMKSGHEGIFERRFEAGRHTYSGPRVDRLKIEERFGPTLTGYIANAPQVAAEEQAKAIDVLMKNIQSQLQRRLALRK